ncbi:hypothetical protein ACFU96_19445 [Streptomyces sp. NPDC057620]|uniref:hypothetical protein n=1 Tax=Streptomyces sp. NPDC057620 TaxID=3346185 RepID=UPI0036BC03CC
MRKAAITALAIRMAALSAAVAFLLLGSPPSASAQCAAPTYHGGLPIRAGSCPEGVARGASGVVWAVAVTGAGVWLARAVARSRSSGDSDLALIDEVFGGEERSGDGEET